MSATLVVAGNELKRLFVQPLAWGVLAATLGLIAYFFLLSLDGFLSVMPKLAGLEASPGVTDLVALPLLRALANLLMLVVPLISMRLISGERRAHTLPLLLASGIGSARIVLGKYCGTLVFLLILLALVVAMPLALSFGTTLDFGKLSAGTLGVALYGAALVALGLFTSSYAEQPTAAAAAALSLSLLFWVLDSGARMQGVNNSAINYLAVPTHLDPFFRGVVASVDVAYFLLAIAVLLLLAVRRLNRLRSAG